MKIFLVFLGGGLGSLCRYFFSLLLNQNINNILPYGTLFVNVAGSFLIGLMFQFFQNNIVPLEIKIFFTIGFFGGFTTFSSFTLESINFLQYGNYKLFFFNIALNNLFSLFFSVIGIYFGKFIIKLIK